MLQVRPPIDTIVHGDDGMPLDCGPNGLVAVAAESSQTFVTVTLMGTAMPLVLMLATPRLRWGVRDMASGEVGAASAERHLSLSEAWLNEHRSPVLEVVPTAAVAEAPLLRLEARLTSSGPAVSCVALGRSGTFDLRALPEAMRQAGSARARLDLTVGTQRVSLGEVRAALGIEGITAEAARVEEGWRLVLAWGGGSIVAGTVVRLWPLARPWEPPVEVPLSEHADHTTVIEVPPIVQGPVLVEIALSDPWGDQPVRPVLEAPAVTWVAFGGVLDQTRHFAAQSDTRRQIERLLAGACSEEWPSV